MRFFVITLDNGASTHGEFADYIDALDYAEDICNGWEFTIEEYDSEDDYLNCL